jgi:hypothetical protein
MLKVPDTHTEQADDAVMPVPVPYVPPAHKLQLAALPSSDLVPYVPATHLRHWLKEVIPEPVS